MVYNKRGGGISVMVSQFLKINKRGGSNKRGGQFFRFLAYMYFKWTYFEVIVTQTKYNFLGQI